MYKYLVQLMLSFRIVHISKNNDIFEKNGICVLCFKMTFPEKYMLFIFAVTIMFTDIYIFNVQLKKVFFCGFLDRKGFRYCFLYQIWSSPPYLMNEQRLYFLEFLQQKPSRKKQHLSFSKISPPLKNDRSAPLKNKSFSQSITLHFCKLFYNFCFCKSFSLFFVNYFTKNKNGWI